MILDSFSDLYTARLSVSDELFNKMEFGKKFNGELAAISDYLNVCVERLHQSISHLEGEKCAVCVKFLVPSENGGEPNIYTYLRDSKSSAVRNSRDRSVPLTPFSDHSPFVDLVENKFGDNLFSCHDLRELTGYDNSRKNWQKIYTSTLIVPIYNNERDIADDIIGFICVDGHNVRFNRHTTGKLMGIVASSIYHVLASHRRIQNLDAKVKPKKKSKAVTKNGNK